MFNKTKKLCGQPLHFPQVGKYVTFCRQTKHKVAGNKSRVFFQVIAKLFSISLPRVPF